MFGWFDRVHEPADGYEWICQFHDLAGTEYWAVAGPWGSRRPASYSVAVERKNSDGTHATLFSARYAVAALPRGFCSKPITEIVRFDPWLGVVEFDLGGQAAWYRLPCGEVKEQPARGQSADDAEPGAAADGGGR